MRGTCPPVILNITFEILTKFYAITLVRWTGIYEMRCRWGKLPGVICVSKAGANLSTEIDIAHAFKLARNRRLPFWNNKMSALVYYLTNFKSLVFGVSPLDELISLYCTAQLRLLYSNPPYSDATVVVSPFEVIVNMVSVRPPNARVVSTIFPFANGRYHPKRSLPSKLL